MTGETKQVKPNSSLSSKGRTLIGVAFYAIGAGLFLSGTSLVGTVGGFILLSYLIDVLSWKFTSKREEYAAAVFFAFLGFDLVYLKIKLYGNYTVPFKHYVIGCLFMVIYIFFLTVILGPVVKREECKSA